MTARGRRTIAQLVVLVPTLFVSYWLGVKGVATLPRLGYSVGVGLVLMAVARVWERSGTED